MAVVEEQFTSYEILRVLTESTHTTHHKNDYLLIKTDGGGAAIPFI